MERIMWKPRCLCNKLGNYESETQDPDPMARERERDLYAGVHLLHTITSQIYAGGYLLRHLL
jgi:hypothetical protein